jgi:hypothetical protein
VTATVIVGHEPTTPVISKELVVLGNPMNIFDLVNHMLRFYVLRNGQVYLLLLKWNLKNILQPLDLVDILSIS